ncbi:MAG: DUF983 domain-containing protein [Flavobacteriaceae bacterium]|nr:DUF983 domain-containing protein [Flavobacteriaceae bacterium]
MQFLKGHKVYSVFTGTCPVCHSGKMYESSGLYRPTETLKMNEHCPHCNTKFKIEPSFFYGAMYVSYGVGVAFAIAVFLVGFLVFKLERFEILLTIVTTLVVLLPVILRLSRNIWINFFFKFDPSKV